jgi:hypothetical protein
MAHPDPEANYPDSELARVRHVSHSFAGLTDASASGDNH